MNESRIKILKKGGISQGSVVYWMQRDQRVNDNWALTYAYNQARMRKEELLVVFNLVDKFLEATIRQYSFMIEGLKEVERNLKKLNLQLYLLTGEPEKNIPKFLYEQKSSLLVTDFNPLKISREWKKKVASKISVPFHEVDAHNIVPVWTASQKAEFAAYTIRPKLNKLLPDFLDDFPPLKALPTKPTTKNNIEWDDLYKSLKVNRDAGKLDDFKPGEKAAEQKLKHFIENKIGNYDKNKNDPNKKALSDMSPYLHFGHISAQRIALMLNDFKNSDSSVSSFLEELMVRRELADNFCFYNNNYDNFEGFHEWAKKTLNEHRKDGREYLYNSDVFENASTHDDLWNAAQMEMMQTGKMHGFMRMYWAKKILEWTESPETAMEIGIYLNDKYELDGRDPNGYAGVAWSIGGVHDRAWSERPVFGKIRYMNYNGCRRKFDVKEYINKFSKEGQKDLFN